MNQTVVSSFIEPSNPFHLKEDVQKDTQAPNLMAEFHELQTRFSSNQRKKAREYTNWVFEGGGAKGIVYVGALKALKERGISPERVAGSSAGAIIAVCIAIGHDADEIEEILNEMDLTSMMDNRATWDPKVMNMGGAKIGIGDAINLFQKNGVFKGEEFLDYSRTLIAKKLSAQIKAHLRQRHAQITSLMPEDQKRAYLEDQYERLLEELQIEDLGRISFEQLDALSKLENMNIKELHIVTTKLTDGSLKAFSAKTDPNMEVALALRMSMSFPFAFEPILYEGHYYADGGIADNMPMSIFDAPEYLTSGLNERGANPNTLGFMVESEEEIAQRWGEKSAPREMNRRNFLKCILEQIHRRFNTLRNKYDTNIIQIKDEGIGTLEFDLSDERKQQAINQGQKVTSDYLEHYSQDLSRQSQDDIDPYYLYFSMSGEQLKANHQEMLQLLNDVEKLIKMLEAAEQYAINRTLFNSFSPDEISKLKKEYDKLEEQQYKISLIEYEKLEAERKLALVKRDMHELIEQYWAIQTLKDNSSDPVAVYEANHDKIKQIVLATKEATLKRVQLEDSLQEINAKLDPLKSELERLELQWQDEKHQKFYELQVLQELRENDYLGQAEALKKNCLIKFGILMEAAEEKGVSLLNPFVDQPEVEEEKATQEREPLSHFPVTTGDHRYEYTNHLLAINDVLNHGPHDEINTQSKADLIHNQLTISSDDEKTYGRYASTFRVIDIHSEDDEEARFHAHLLSPTQSQIDDPTKLDKEIMMVFDDPYTHSTSKYKQYLNVYDHARTRAEDFDARKKSFLKQLEWAVNRIDPKQLKQGESIKLTLCGAGLAGLDAQLMLAEIVHAMRHDPQSPYHRIDTIELLVKDEPKVSMAVKERFQEDMRAGNFSNTRLSSYHARSLTSLGGLQAQCYLGETSMFTNMSNAMDVTMDIRDKKQRQTKHLSNADDDQKLSRTLELEHWLYPKAIYRWGRVAAHNTKALLSAITTTAIPLLAKCVIGAAKFGIKAGFTTAKLPFRFAKSLFHSMGRIFKKKKKAPRYSNWAHDIEQLENKDEPQVADSPRPAPLLVKEASEEQRLAREKRPPVENLVLHGVNEQAYAHIGALKALEEHGQLNHVKRVMGSSMSGPLLALLAVGYSVDDIEKIMTQDISTSDLRDAPSPWIPRLFRVAGHELGLKSVYDLFVHKGLYKGEAFADLMNDFINAKVEEKVKREILKELDPTFLENFNDIFEEKGPEFKSEFMDEYLNKRFKELCFKLGIDDPSHLTFSNLKVLNERFPALDFKELTLTGSRLDDNRMCYFNADDPIYKDMPISKAIQITMCIPGLNIPCTHEGEGLYVSGVVTDPYPIEYYNRSEFLSHGLDESNKNPCTLGLIVGSEQDMNARWGNYEEQKGRPGISKYAAQVLEAMHKRSEKIMKFYHENSVDIVCKKGNYAFKTLSQKDKAEAIQDGYDALNQHLNLYFHPDALYDSKKDYKSVQQKYYSKKPQQMAHILKHELQPLIDECKRRLDMDRDTYLKAKLRQEQVQKQMLDVFEPADLEHVDLRDVLLTLETAIRDDEQRQKALNDELKNYQAKIEGHTSGRNKLSTLELQSLKEVIQKNKNIQANLKSKQGQDRVALTELKARLNQMGPLTKTQQKLLDEFKASSKTIKLYEALESRVVNLNYEKKVLLDAVRAQDVAYHEKLTEGVEQSTISPRSMSMVK